MKKEKTVTGWAFSVYHYKTGMESVFGGIMPLKRIKQIHKLDGGYSFGKITKIVLPAPPGKP